MIIDWDVADIINQINKISRAENDPYETGFNTWGAKQDLYLILWHIQDRLEQCSTYADEEEYLRNHSKKQIWNALKGK